MAARISARARSNEDTTMVLKVAEKQTSVVEDLEGNLGRSVVDALEGNLEESGVEAHNMNSFILLSGATKSDIIDNGCDTAVIFPTDFFNKRKELDNSTDTHCRKRLKLDFDTNQFNCTCEYCFSWMKTNQQVPCKCVQCENRSSEQKHFKDKQTCSCIGCAKWMRKKVAHDQIKQERFRVAVKIEEHTVRATCSCEECNIKWVVKHDTTGLKRVAVKQELKQTIDMLG